MAYKTLVRPLVEYSSSVWSPYTKSNIARLEMVQRRAARWTLSEYSPYASVTQMLESIKKTSGYICIRHRPQWRIKRVRMYKGMRGSLC